MNINLETARHQLEVAQQQYGESHPRVKQLVSNIDHAKRLLREREAQIDAQGVDGDPLAAGAGPGASMDQLEQTLKKQDRAIALLHEAIERQQAKVAEAGEIARQIARYDEETLHKRELYETVRMRLKELAMESKAPARIGVAAYAIESSEPHSDRRLVLTALSAVGAMMVSLAVGYLRMSTDPKIREAREVKGMGRAPFLGQLPMLSPAEVSRPGCDPLVSEGMRMVRTSLLERLHGTKNPIVLITSATSRTGKTTVGIELGMSLAQLGKKTLLVEGDLRRPAIAQRMGLKTSTGLAALLTHEATMGDVVVSGGIPKFDVVPAGQLPDDFDTELLANGGLHSLSVSLARSVRLRTAGQSSGAAGG